MSNTLRLLLVDDEETFRLSSADLLRLEGYRVDAAADAQSALVLMSQYNYDLIISDINMPGNDDLAFIHAIERAAPGTPVILVTGYPSVDTAIDAVRLPVVDYLIKPVNMADLKVHCEIAVQAVETRKAMDKAQQRVVQWETAITQMKMPAAGSVNAQTSHQLQSFLNVTMDNILGSIMDLNRLTQSLAQNEEPVIPCVAAQCPELNRVKAMLTEAVNVLEETKTAFKSKRLYALRKKLEATLLSLESDTTSCV